MFSNMIFSLNHFYTNRTEHFFVVRFFFSTFDRTHYSTVNCLLKNGMMSFTFIDSYFKEESKHELQLQYAKFALRMIWSLRSEWFRINPTEIS